LLKMLYEYEQSTKMIILEYKTLWFPRKCSQLDVEK